MGFIPSAHEARREKGGAGETDGGWGLRGEHRDGGREEPEQESVPA